MALWWAVFLGCGTSVSSGGPPEMTDDLRYLRALEAPVEVAAALCEGIEAQGQAGECLSGVAVRRAGEGVDALETCRQIAHEGWRWECHLRVVEAAPLIGAEAEDACAASGRFQRVCQFHALEAEVMSMGWSDDTIGQEAARWSTLRETVARYRDLPSRDDALPARAESMTVDDHAGTILHRRVVERFARRPFETRLCGTLSEAACGRAVREAWLSQVSPSTWQAQVCGQDALRDAFMDAGGMGWTTVSDEVARRIVQPLCEALARDVSEPDALRKLGADAPRFSGAFTE